MFLQISLVCMFVGLLTHLEQWQGVCFSEGAVDCHAEGPVDGLADPAGDARTHTRNSVHTQNWVLHSLCIQWIVMDSFLEYVLCGFFLQVQKEQGGAGKVAAAAAASEILILF